MAEDKRSGPPAGKDLVAKIAKAYRSLPEEQRTRAFPTQDDVQNPELDIAFDKMVAMYKVRRPERENSVVSFPAPPTPPIAKPAASGEYECQECGHENPASNQFCGMCGAAREEKPAPSPVLEISEPLEMQSAPAEGSIKHHHHHYHHYHYRNNPLLLVAIMLLLGIIAWQQWLEYRRTATNPVTNPAQVQRQVQPPAPAQAQPVPESVPVPQAQRSATPSRQPAGRPAKARTGRAPAAGGSGLAYPPISHQAIPVLPVFSNTPAPVEGSGDAADQNKKLVWEVSPELR